MLVSRASPSYLGGATRTCGEPHSLHFPFTNIPIPWHSSLTQEWFLPKCSGTTSAGHSANFCSSPYLWSCIRSSHSRPSTHNSAQPNHPPGHQYRLSSASSPAFPFHYLSSSTLSQVCSAHLPPLHHRHSMIPSSARLVQRRPRQEEYLC